MCLLSFVVPVVRLKSTLHLKSTLLLKITLILKYSRISLIYCQMQLIWVLVSTNDVLNNWIIMVLKKCKRIPIKKESIIGLEGRLKILWVEKYSKSIVVLLCWSTGLTQRLEVSGFWNGICMLFSLRAMELSMHYCERLYGGDAIRRLLWHAYALFKKTGDIRYSRLRHARTVSGTRFAGCVQNCRRIRHQRLCRDQPADARPLTKRHFLQGCRDAHE